MNKIFVYGTLKPGHGRWPILRDVAEDYYPVTTEGRLVSFGAYPGAVFHTDKLDEFGVVHGYVVEVADGNFDYIMTILDGIEGVHRGLFHRTLVPFWPEDGDDEEPEWAHAYQICTVPEGKWQPELDEE